MHKSRSVPERRDASTAAGELLVPALRCRMGSWIYYCAAMRLGDVAARVSLATAIHPSHALNELIQRAVTSRAHDIGEYLVRQSKERFFSSIVVGVYDGEPDWLDIQVQENPILDPEDMPESIRDTLGILRLSGGERLFALDGQHRVVGIQDAIALNPAIADEQMTALFVAHSMSPAGMERSRRLFTTLNRYAKPVGKKDVIALDEDDAVAIITRRLVDGHPLFRNKISLRATKSMPSSNENEFTSIVALYDALDIYLRHQFASLHKNWNKFKRFRPPETVLRDGEKAATKLFDGIAMVFPAVRAMAAAPQINGVAGKFRSRAGGHLLFRPIGLTILVRVLVALRDDGLTERQSIERIASVPMDIAVEPWSGLLWDPSNRRMIVRSENQNLAVKILYYGAGGDLRKMDSSATKLGRELAGLMNRDESVHVRRYA